MASFDNPFPQSAPGATAAKGHVLDNGIPLSIFPISRCMFLLCTTNNNRNSSDKLCFCICGLPARGKTHISQRIARYLEFFHSVPVKVFDVAEYRRKMGFNRIPDLQQETDVELRRRCYDLALEDLATFLGTHDDGVAILDASSNTHLLRLSIRNKVLLFHDMLTYSNLNVIQLQSIGVKLVFIQVENNDADFLRGQFKLAANLSPDYADYTERHEAVNMRSFLYPFRL